jgi:hypothetical protein
MPMWIRADDMTGVAPQDTDGSPMDAIRPKYLVGSATDLVMGPDPTMPQDHTVLSLLVGRSDMMWTLRVNSKINPICWIAEGQSHDGKSLAYNW